MWVVLAVPLRTVADVNGPALGMVEEDALEVAKVVPLSFLAATVHV
jgi:hypothetical protein